MKRVCAWCQKDMGTTPSTNSSESIITHGICGECAREILERQGVDLRTFLDNLAAPVIVVDEAGNVSNANKQARVLLKKDLPDIKGSRSGNVFECIHAKLPEGCGKTIHCDGCTIRMTVMDTFQSGKSHLKTPACLCRGTPDHCTIIDILISTEKIRDVVLLRIDKMNDSQEI